MTDIIHDHLSLRADCPPADVWEGHMPPEYRNTLEADS